MNFRHIGIGTKIELELFDRNGDVVKPILVSQYETFDEKANLIEIHVPFLEGKIYSIHPGTLMNIIFSKDNDTYMFKAQAVSREMQGPIAIQIVRPVSAIERIERRSFFRMDCRLNINYRIIKVPKDDDADNFTEAVTRDISGGGVCIIADSMIDKGTMIEGYIQLKRDIRFIGTVVRTVKVREEGRFVYDIGVEFKEIENWDREHIISYVFETQRERLKRGWKKV
jgi:c-di-GMP-binding flagellar brake protein YcgR